MLLGFFSWCFDRMNVCEGDTSPFLEVTDVSFDSVCALLYLVNANPRILERLSTLGERIINGSNPRRASTLCSAWNLLNHLYSQACYLPLEEAINECFALLDEQPKAKDFPDEATRVSQAMRVACRDALSETPFFASSPASPVTPLSLVVNKSLEGAQRPVKIFMDGVFDLVHSGKQQCGSLETDTFVILLQSLSRSFTLPVDHFFCCCGRWRHQTHRRCVRFNVVLLNFRTVLLLGVIHFAL